jgi:hypothetical protein
MRHNAQELMTKFREYLSYKQRVMTEWRLVRSMYRGEFWKIFKKHMKDYTVTPDWNYFEYVVQAYLNSIYSGAFIGHLTPVDENDSTKIEALNAFISYLWGRWGMKNKFLHIGEQGELYNFGPVRVDWDTKKKHIKIKALSPHELYIDPNVDNYLDGEAVFIERAVSINTLKNNPDFKDAVNKYTENNKNFVDKTLPNRLSGSDNQPSATNKMVSLIECFIRNDKDTLDQIFILDETEIIYEKTELPIENFPVVIFSPQRPDANPYGSSKLLKIFNTTVALNLLDSLEATQPFRLLNRVRFVNVDGRINMRAFADFGNTPGASFETKGDPRTLIHYQDIPTIPDLTNLKNRLENSIFQVTGVDPYYKGRMTNSLQTTGATQAFQARVTMLTDNSRITLLEEFCENLTKTVLDFYFAYGGDHEYTIPQLSATGTNKVVNKFRLKFSDMKELKYDYHIAASTLLPMNQANLFESAKALYEMQGQYNFKKQIVTEQDLVRFSDFPQKDMWLQRLEKQDQESVAENLIADLTNFASIFSRMLAQGLSEEEAAQQAINILIEEKNAMQQDPTLGRGFE